VSSEKGKFSTDIGSEVIEAALGSVAKRTGDAPEVEVPVPEEQPAAASEAPLDRTSELQSQLELSMAKGREMMEKIKDSHERMLRAVADLDNYKKRALKEKDEVQKYGIEKVLKDLLPVVDNLDRALEHAHSSADFESLKQGLAMTRKLFLDALAKSGVSAFSATGQPFDPRLHEAMQQVETNDVPPNQVVSEVVRGYMLHDRLVRPALVVVSKPAAASGEGERG
jgi:molecular chaperone GrpE